MTTFAFHSTYYLVYGCGTCLLCELIELMPLVYLVLQSLALPVDSFLQAFCAYAQSGFSSLKSVAL